MSDADPQARKTARVLYWLLRQRPAWSRPLQLLVDLLDNTTKKNLDTEQYQSEFLEIIRNRAYLSNIDVYDLDWKDMDTPHFSRNASLSSSGRLSVGSDMPSLKSDDEDDIRKNDDKLTSLQDPELIDQTEGMADSSLPQPEMSANRVDKIETPNLREQTIALKSNKQFSASTGNLGRTGGIGGGCQRLTVAPKLPQTEEENHEKPNPTSARASLSTSLMTKRFEMILFFYHASSD